MRSLPSLFTLLDETDDGPLRCVSGEGRRDGLPDAFDGVTPAFQVGALIDIDESSGRALRITRVDEAGLTQTVLSKSEPAIDVEQTPSPEQT